MNLQELLTQLDTPIVIRPTRRMTHGELETYLDKAADILRGNADHSEFRGLPKFSGEVAASSGDTSLTRQCRP
jgi:hypothetical protein